MIIIYYHQMFQHNMQSVSLTMNVDCSFPLKKSIRGDWIFGIWVDAPTSTTSSTLLLGILSSELAFNETFGIKYSIVCIYGSLRLSRISNETLFYASVASIFLAVTADAAVRIQWPIAIAWRRRTGIWQCRHRRFLCWQGRHSIVRYPSWRPGFHRGGVAFIIQTFDSNGWSEFGKNKDDTLVLLVFSNKK